MVYNCRKLLEFRGRRDSMSEPTAYTFSGHETFPFRYPWLKKGFDAVREDVSVFGRDDAITTLGVGKNMVRSIRHWCLAAGHPGGRPRKGRSGQGRFALDAR